MFSGCFVAQGYAIFSWFNFSLCVGSNDLQHPCVTHCCKRFIFRHGLMYDVFSTCLTYSVGKHVLSRAKPCAEALQQVIKHTYTRVCILGSSQAHEGSCWPNRLWEREGRRVGRRWSYHKPYCRVVLLTLLVVFSWMDGLAPPQTSL